MSDSNAEKRDDHDAAAVAETPAGYEPPRIVWEESFDQQATLAAACGKSNPGQGEGCMTFEAS